MLITFYKDLFVSNYPSYIRNMFTFRSCKYNLRGTYIDITYIFINPRSHMTIQDAKTVSDEIEIENRAKKN